MTLSIATIFLATTRANVQAGPSDPRYKVGDRVEFSENGACLGAQFAVESKGTVEAVNLGSR